MTNGQLIQYGIVKLCFCQQKNKFYILKSLIIFCITIDTAQTLGIGQQHNSGQIVDYKESPYPISDLAKKVGKVIYNNEPKLKAENINGTYVLKQ